MEKLLCSIPIRNAPGTEGGVWDGLGMHIRAHRLRLLAPSGVLRQGHYPLMALQGQPFVKRAGSPSPVLSTGKAVPANWAPPRQGWGVNVPQRWRAKCREGPEEGLDVFQFPAAWFPPAHQVMCGALCCPGTLCSSSPLTLPKNTSEKGLKGSGTEKHLDRG